MSDRDAVRPNVPLLLVAWAVVSVPTLWGLSYTIQSAMKIFNTGPAVSHGTAPAPAALANSSPNARP